MANRLSPRQQAAKLRKRHPQTGTFVKQRTNGNSKTSPQYSTPVGISTDLMRILRPQAAFRWILPNIAAITPQYIEMTMRGALAGNHVQQWELFDLMMDTWPELSACFQELTYGVLSKNLIYEPHHDEDEPPDPDAIDKHKLVSVALGSMSPDPARDENDLRGTIKDLLDSWLRGITVLETLWQSVDDDAVGTIMAPQSTFWVHPVAYGFNADGQLGLRTIGNGYNPGSPTGTAGNARNTPPISAYPFSYLSAQPQPATLEPFPAHKFLIGIHKSKPGTALGGPLLRPLAWWWVASNFSSDWLLNLAQLFGLPFRWATYDPNSPDETIAAIQNMLQNMGSAGWAAFPAGTEMEFKEGSSQRGADTPQDKLLDRADRYARLLVLGQTMTGNTMTSGKGGQAFGVVEKDVKQERIDAAGKYACEVINKQLINSVLLLNYGEASNAPRVRLLEENEGQFVDAQRDQVLINMGLPFGADFLRKKYGVPEPAEGEEIIEKQQMPNPFGGDQQNQDGNPDQLNQSQPGPDAVASASGAYAPGHEFYGNQWTGGTYYHGTGKTFDAFNPPANGKAIWLTSEKADAERYAGIATRYSGEEPRVIQAHVKVSKDATDRVKQLSGQMSSAKMHEQLKQEGFDAYRDGPNAVILNHKAISIHHPFPSITHSAENERRLLQNQGIQTKEGTNATATEPPPQVINVTVEAAKVTQSKSFTIKRADGTVIEGEIAAKEPNE